MKTLAAVLLFVAGGIAVAAWLHVSRQPYYPVARIAAPEGITYTAFSAETPGADACRDANTRFVAPIVEHCAACEVLFARCERKDEALRLRLASAASAHVVLAPGLHITIAGPGSAAAESCRLIVADLHARRIPAARCLDP